MSTLLEKREKIVIYLQHYTDLHKIWHDDAEHLSRARAVKNQNPRWPTADTFERPVLHHYEMSHFCQYGCCPPSWIFEMRIFNSRAL